MCNFNLNNTTITLSWVMVALRHGRNALLCPIHPQRLHGWHNVLSEICSKALYVFTWDCMEPEYPCPESIPFGRTAEQGSSSSLVWMTARNIQRRHTVFHKHAYSRDKETVMEQYYHHIHSHTYCILSLSAMWAGKSRTHTNRGI